MYVHAKYVVIHSCCATDNTVSKVGLGDTAEKPIIVVKFHIGQY